MLGNLLGFLQVKVLPQQLVIWLCSCGAGVRTDTLKLGSVPADADRRSVLAPGRSGLTLEESVRRVAGRKSAPMLAATRAADAWTESRARWAYRSVVRI